MFTKQEILFRRLNCLLRVYYTNTKVILILTVTNNLTTFFLCIVFRLKLKWQYYSTHDNLVFRDEPIAGNFKLLNPETSLFFVKSPTLNLFNKSTPISKKTIIVIKMF